MPMITTLFSAQLNRHKAPGTAVFHPPFAFSLDVVDAVIALVAIGGIVLKKNNLDQRILHYFFGTRKIPTIEYRADATTTEKFTTTAKPRRAILEGKFNYNEAFATFIASTKQKQDTAKVTKALVEKLKNKIEEEKNNHLLENVSLCESGKVLDIGCATSTTCIGFLEGIQKVTSTSGNSKTFSYFGVDNNPIFIKSAGEVLTSKKRLIDNFTLIECDALDGNLPERQELVGHSFDLIFMSHTAYYLKDEEACKKFLVGIEKLISPSGITCFYHENSTSYFRTKYNPLNFDNKPPAPLLLANSATNFKSANNQFTFLTFTSHLTFAPLDSSVWECMKDPTRYSELENNTDALETLEKLAFIVQRDLIGMHKEGTLSRYIDDIKQDILLNKNRFALTTHMQVLLSSESKLAKIIGPVMQEVQGEIQTIINPEHKRSKSEDFFVANGATTLFPFPSRPRSLSEGTTNLSLNAQQASPPLFP